VIARKATICIGLLVSLLVVNGCNNQDANSICSVSLGTIQGTISDSSTFCAYPGLVTLPDGNLLTGYSCPGGIVVFKLSRDKGATWEDHSAMTLKGSPSLTVLPNHKIALSTTLKAGSGYNQPVYMVGTIGDGDQITWGDPVIIATPGWTKGCVAPSPAVQLKDGELLVPVWCLSNTTGGLPGSSTVMLSADGGLTWPRQITVGDGEIGGSDFDESAAEVYPNGDVVMIIRRTTHTDNDLYGVWLGSRSVDNGRTWSTPIQVADNLIVGRPTVALLPSGGLVLAGRAEVEGVYTTGFATSWDEGLTFSRFHDLGFENYGFDWDQYDAMSLLPDGSIGIVSAHAGYGEASEIAYRDLVDHCSVTSIAP